MESIYNLSSRLLADHMALSPSEVRDIALEIRDLIDDLHTQLGEADDEEDEDKKKQDISEIMRKMY